MTIQNQILCLYGHISLFAFCTEYFIRSINIYSKIEVYCFKLKKKLSHGLHFDKIIFLAISKLILIQCSLEEVSHLHQCSGVPTGQLTGEYDYLSPPLLNRFYTYMTSYSHKHFLSANKHSSIFRFHPNRELPLPSQLEYLNTNNPVYTGI